MIRHLVACLVIASLMLVAPRAAEAAAITHTYTAVDAVELQYTTSGYLLLVTGVSGGGSAASTQTFRFQVGEVGGQQAERCERMAQIAMSKPGKFQFGIGTSLNPTVTNTVCKLIRIEP